MYPKQQVFFIAQVMMCHSPEVFDSFQLSTIILFRGELLNFQGSIWIVLHEVGIIFQRQLWLILGGKVHGN